MSSSLAHCWKICFFLTFNRISAASKLSFERFILTSKTECSNLLLHKMFTVLMLKKACFARTCFGIWTIQLAIKKNTVVYLHMTLSCFFQRRYISGTMQNSYCCAYFKASVCTSEATARPPTYSGKSCTRDTIAKILDNNESNLEIILDKMKDHVDNLDSMAQLEVIPTPAKTETLLPSRCVVITLVVSNDYMVQRTAKWLICSPLSTWLLTLFSSKGPSVIAYTLVHVLYSVVEKNLPSNSLL